MLVSVLSVPEEVVEGWVEDDMAGDGKMVVMLSIAFRCLR